MSRQVLFVLAILASSFLIFLVQPMVGKRILPWFGGTPSVWTLCLAFYQTTLFAGYAYAHLLIRFATPRAQFAIHALVVAAALIALPVLPNNSWQNADMSNPSGQILAMLTANVALPFLALASTGPLVQAWFARAYPNRSPYPLYAVSNIGSFAALLAYPFLFEPRLSLSATGTLWSYAFAATVIAVLGCAFLAQSINPVSNSERDENLDDEARPITPLTVMLWILLSGSAVVLLMGTTNSVCLDVASVPFLWIIPLATYLLTFILAFATDRNYHPVRYAILTLVTFFLTVGLQSTLILFDPLVGDVAGANISVFVYSIYFQIPAYCALLFGGCMLMHGEVYRLRPSPQHLTAFYLCVSGGGAIGGLFVGIAAPVLFDDYLEIRIGLGLVLVLFLIAQNLRAAESKPTTKRPWPKLALNSLGAIAGLYLLLPPDIGKQTIHIERSFFGVLQIVEPVSHPVRQRHLVSGSTLHGVEFHFGQEAPKPTSYYGEATGIAAAFGQLSREDQSNVGLIGLGVGTLSAYGRPGDDFRYYEIDPAVAYLARDSGYFTFLERSPANIEVVVADARLAITEEQAQHGSQNFDMLVLDAFSSDAIPVHLLTIEAFRIYLNALAPGGILAVHVSNRHFDLIPLVARAGHEVGLTPLLCTTYQALQFQSQGADWLFLSVDKTRLIDLANLIRKRTRRLKLPANHAKLKQIRKAEVAHVPLWTDDYSDLFSVLRSQ